MVKVLKKYGGDPEIKDLSGKTAFDYLPMNMNDPFYEKLAELKMNSIKRQIT